MPHGVQWGGILAQSGGCWWWLHPLVSSLMVKQGHAKGDLLWAASCLASHVCGFGVPSHLAPLPLLGERSCHGGPGASCLGGSIPFRDSPPSRAWAWQQLRPSPPVCCRDGGAQESPRSWGAPARGMLSAVLCWGCPRCRSRRRQLCPWRWRGQVRADRDSSGSVGRCREPAPAVTHHRAGGGQAWPRSQRGPCHGALPAAACRKGVGMATHSEVKSRAVSCVLHPIWLCTPSGCAPPSSCAPPHSAEPSPRHRCIV